MSKHPVELLAGAWVAEVSVHTNAETLLFGLPDKEVTAVDAAPLICSFKRVP
jgi:hypothetical protein